MNRLTVILAVTMALIALASPTLARADGELDPSFGSGGVTMAPAGGTEDVADAVTLDPQGGVLAAGWAHVGGQLEFSVERFLDNGTVDDGFGFHGAQTTVIGPTGQDIATGVAVDSLGRIVLAGRSLNGSHYQFAVARFSAGGQPDLSFGSLGVKSTAIGPGSALGTAVAVDSQNRILVAGSSANGANVVFTLARYLPSGELDGSFGSGGIVNTPLVGDDTPEAMAVDSQGRIVLAGKAVVGGNDDFLVARYLPSGELDHSFGVGSGFVQTSLVPGDDTAKGVAVDSQGRIVVAGTATIGGAERFAVVRYDVGGNLDPTFGSGGLATALVGSEDSAGGVAIDAQDRPVVVGSSIVSPNRDFTLVRFTAAGGLDPSFGSGGAVATTVGNGLGGASALTIGGTGRITVAGFGSTGSQVEFTLARYLGDQTPPAVEITGGPADGSFTNDPTPSFSFSSPEASTGFLCGIGTAGTSCSSPFTTPQLADGPHTFVVVGVDPAGNRSIPASRTFTVDTRPPSVTVKGRRLFKVGGKRGRAHFKLAADEPATLSCQVDHRKARPCTGRLKTPKLKLGKHLLRVSATDRAGNLGRAVKRFRIATRPHR